MVYSAARRSRGRRASPTGAPFSGLVGLISSPGFGILPYVLASVLAICAGLGTIPLAGRAGIDTRDEVPEDCEEPPTAVLPEEADADESSIEVD